MAEEKLWAHLEDELQRRVRSFPGVAGVHVRDLTAPHRISVAGDVTFPTASMIKMHVLAHLFELAEAASSTWSAPSRSTPARTPVAAACSSTSTTPRDSPSRTSRT